MVNELNSADRHIMGCLHSLYYKYLHNFIGITGKPVHFFLQDCLTFPDLPILIFPGKDIKQVRAQT